MEEVRLSRRCRPSMQVAETRLAFHVFDMSACFFGTCRMAFGVGAVRPDISINVNLLLGKSAGDAQYPQWHRYTMVCTYGTELLCNASRKVRSAWDVSTAVGLASCRGSCRITFHIIGRDQDSQMSRNSSAKCIFASTNKISTPMAVTRGIIEH